MGIILDIILLAAAIAFIVSGIRKGFVISIMNIVSFVAALISGYYLGPAVSGFIKNNLIQGKVAESITSVIESLINSGVNKITMPQIFQDKPAAFVDITDRYDVTVESVESYYNDQLSEGVSDAIEKVSEFISAPVVDTLSSVLGFLLVFIISLIVFRIVIMLIDLMCRLPVLNFTNRLLGGIFGVICGYLCISVLAMVAENLIPALSSVWPEAINEKILTTSVMYNLIRNINVFDMIF